MSRGIRNSLYARHADADIARIRSRFEIEETEIDIPIIMLVATDAECYRVGQRQSCVNILKGGA